IIISDPQRPVVVVAKTTGLISTVHSDGNEGLVHEVYAGRNLGFDDDGQPSPRHPGEYFRIEYDPAEDSETYGLLKAKLRVAQERVQAWQNR
ncbi:MAG: hypothetical protein KKD94_06485, partial [Nanoarchaeota archaeon]|nr:hypothetical protein [Nanoarchaeota archaeon]